MKNIIKTIWEIKTTIDEAIDKQDEELFNSARERFIKIYNEKEYLKSISTSTIDYIPENNEYMLMDREQNFATISFELHKDSKRVKGEDIGYCQFQFSSIFELIWWNCWMFNNFIKNAERNINLNENMKIFNAIDANLSETIRYYENFLDDRSVKEKFALMRIYRKIHSKYNELYESLDNKNN